MELTKEAQERLKINQLAKATQVCGISNRNSLPATARALVAKADASKQPLSGDELKTVCDCCETSEYAVALLIAKSSQVVDAARQQLLKQQPHLILPGGELYPENRAEACWRDCQQFLRVIIYGVACDCAEITDSDGMAALRQLYELMEVPVPAMMYALNQIRSLTAQALETSGHIRELACLNMAFDNLIEALLPTQFLMPRS